MNGKPLQFAKNKNISLKVTNKISVFLVNSLLRKKKLSGRLRSIKKYGHSFSLVIFTGCSARLMETRRLNVCKLNTIIQPVKDFS
jgi:hypothetical protein